MLLYLVFIDCLLSFRVLSPLTLQVALTDTTKTVGVQHPQGQIPGGPSPPDARPSQAFCGRVRCLQIRMRSSPTTARCQRRLASMQLLITVFQCYRTELRDLRQGIVGHHSSSNRMAPLLTRITPPCHSVVRPQKPHLFLDSAEIESMTSTMELIPFRI